MSGGAHIQRGRRASLRLEHHAVGSLKPEDKQRLVQELKQRGAKVVVAGDGINDAPALAEADVRIAMGTGNGCGDF
jgi:P-type E1-E2 ATPase